MTEIIPELREALQKLTADVMREWDAQRAEAKKKIWKKMMEDWEPDSFDS